MCGVHRFPNENGSDLLFIWDTTEKVFLEKSSPNDHTEKYSLVRLRLEVVCLWDETSRVAFCSGLNALSLFSKSHLLRTVTRRRIDCTKTATSEFNQPWWCKYAWRRPETCFQTRRGHWFGVPGVLDSAGVQYAWYNLLGPRAIKRGECLNTHAQEFPAKLHYS